MTQTARLQAEIVRIHLSLSVALRRPALVGGPLPQTLGSPMEWSSTGPVLQDFRDSEEGLIAGREVAFQLDFRAMDLEALPAQQLVLR